MGNTSYGNINNTSYGSVFGVPEETRGQRVQRLLDKSKKMIEFNYMTANSFGRKANNTTQGAARHGLGTTGMHTSFLDKTTYPGGEEEDSMIQQMAQQSRKIGPFSFDIDDDIDTEVLTNDEIFRDLKELEGILDKDSDKVVSTRMLGRKKRSHR